MESNADAIHEDGEHVWSINWMADQDHRLSATSRVSLRRPVIRQPEAGATIQAGQTEVPFSGTGEPGSDIVLYEVEGSSRAPLARGVVDTDGTWNLPGVGFAADGTYTLELEATVGQNKATSNQTTITIASFPTATITGQVTDGYGLPLVGVRVRLVEPDDAGGAAMPRSDFVETGRDGRYTLQASVAPGRYQVEVWLEDIDGRKQIIYEPAQMGVQVWAPVFIDPNDKTEYEQDIDFGNLAKVETSLPAQAQPFLDDLAAIYYYLWSVQDFVHNDMKSPMYQPVEKVLTWTPPGNTFFVQGTEFIHLGSDYSEGRSSEKIDAIRHETFHHVMWETINEAMIQGTNYGVGHGGFENPTTQDSWVEGWAEFWPCAMKDYPVFMPTMTSIEYNWRAWDTWRMSRTWQDWVTIPREEFAVAGVLWDLYDGRDAGDEDNIDISTQDLWKVLTGVADEGEPRPPLPILVTKREDPHYAMTFVDSGPFGDTTPIRVPQYGETDHKWARFAWISTDPAPKASDLGLYLRKDPDGVSSPLPRAANLPSELAHMEGKGSYFHHPSWQSSPPDVADGFFRVGNCAEDAPVQGSQTYRCTFQLHGNGCTVETCPDTDIDRIDLNTGMTLPPEYYREDFGIFNTASGLWMTAPRGEGGNPDSLANAWFSIVLIPDATSIETDEDETADETEKKEQITDVRSLYTTLLAAAESGELQNETAPATITKADLDQIFISHGFYAEQDWRPIDMWKIGFWRTYNDNEDIGWGGRVARHSTVRVDGAYVKVNFVDKDNNPVSEGTVDVFVDFEYDHYDYTYSVDVSDPSALIYVEPPPTRTHTLVNITARNTTDTDVLYSIDNETYWNKVGKSSQGYVDDVTFIVKTDDHAWWKSPWLYYSGGGLCGVVLIGGIVTALVVRGRSGRRGAGRTSKTRRTTPTRRATQTRRPASRQRPERRRPRR
jgi:hypothetical protein